MSLQDDIAMYRKELAIQKQMKITPLKPGDELIRVGSKITLLQTSQMTHKSHDIVVMKVTNQPHYKKNNGNARGVYMDSLRTIFFTKHYSGLETEVPVMLEPLPSYVIAEGLREVCPGITANEFWTEFAFQVGKRIETENYLRKKRRK